MDHHRFHQNITKFFYCGFDGKCRLYIQTDRYLSTHIIRSHGVLSKKSPQKHINYPANNTEKFVCTVEICKKEFYQFPHLVQRMKTHIRSQQEIKCPYPKCKKKYSLISSFSGHLSTRHRNCTFQLDIEPSVNVNNDSDNQSNLNNLEQTNDLNLSVNNENIMQFPTQSDDNMEKNMTSSKNSPEESSNLFLENFAQFYLKLESEFFLPSTTVQYIVTQINSIHEEGQEIIKKKLMEHLYEENIGKDKIDKYLEIFNSDPFLNSNDVLKTTYRRKNYYKKQFNYVEPVSIEINKETKTKFCIRTNL